MSYQNKKSTGERSVGLIFVVIFHVLLVWGLASGLGHQITSKVADVIQTKVVEDETPKEEVEPPPPPPDTKIPPPDFVPPPSFDFVPDAGPTTAIQAVSKEPPKVAPAPSAVTAPIRKKTNTLPKYPPADERAGNEGVVSLNIYVQEDGRVSEVKLLKTSGFDSLDEAAMNHIRRTWKFTPCMQGETPVACWSPLNVRMQIEKK